LGEGFHPGFDDLGKSDFAPVSVKVSLSSLFVPRHGMGLLMIMVKAIFGFDDTDKSGSWF